MVRHHDQLPMVGGQSIPTIQTFMDDWLDDQEAERDELIMKLRRVERNLVKHGRLRPQETRPKRIR
ncbi:MAG: hypothetical protein HC804_02390 [Anaerolineae bacterium]|nr:hypothetical protein [Anaerolineae bacterium]